MDPFSTGPYRQHITRAVGASFRALIKKYQKTIYAQKAYDQFLENYDSTHRSQIEEATTNNPVIQEHFEGGIQNKGQAKLALESTHYIQAATIFRQIGLLTGIDVESLGDPAFTITALDWGFTDTWNLITKSAASDRKDDILYNTGVTPVASQPTTKIGYGFIDINPSSVFHTGERLDRVLTAPTQFFADTSILQYLSNKAYLITEAGGVGADNPFKTLAKNLAENTRDLIAKYYIATAQEYGLTPDDPSPPDATTGPFRGAPFTHLQWILNSRDKMSSIAGTIEQIGADPVAELNTYGKPELPLQEFMPSHTTYNAGHMGSGRSGNVTPLYYAAIDTAQSKQITTDWIKTLILGIDSYLGLFNEIIAKEVGTLGDDPEQQEAEIEMATSNILAYFGVGRAQDPLDDTPQVGSLSQAITDPVVGPPLEEALEAARRNLNPFDMQCYLMENIQEIVAQRDRPSAAFSGADPFRRDYHHSKILATNGVSPALVTNTLQYGGPGSDKSQRIKQILNLCPEVYASLVPYIKIYRVDYDENGDIAIDTETDLPVEKELVIPNFIDPTDLSSILDSSRGRIPGAGIKSFSWSLVGVQPAEVDNNITAKLVVYFQSINDFFRGANQAGKEEPNFLDLLINSPAVKDLQEAGSGTPADAPTVCGLQKNLHRRYEGKNYRIKVVAGWSAPSNLLDLMPKSDPDDVEKLIQSIDETKVSLFLQQVRHSLDFKDDGALEMSIDYQASLAGLLTSPRADIFGEDPIHIREQIKDIDIDIDLIDNQDESIRESEPNKKKMKALLEKKKELNTRGKMYKYKKLLQGLFDPGDHKIHAIELSGAELMLPPYRDLDPEQRAARAKRRMTTDLEFTDTFELYGELLTAVSTAADEAGANAADQYAECTDARYRAIRPDSKKTAVSFWFLGDIIDNVIAQMKKNNAGKELSFDVFLSDVDMIDPLMAVQLKNLDDVLNCGDIREIEFLETLRRTDPGTFANFDLVNIMNIGDIPISTDAFQLFFKNRVVKKDRETYHFLYFIKELCAELITKALNKTCFGPDISFQQRFDARPLTYISDSETKRPFTSLRHLAKQSDILPSTPIGDTRQALIILPTNSHPRNLVGDYAKDTAKGIYHQYIGASCGLLKTLKFNREDQDYLRESKIQRQGALGAEQLRELYSSTLELVGNNLYKNGMYIYINPTLMDADEVQLDYLGLHGYYLVTGVQSSVTPQGFTTSLTALHEGIEFNAPGMNAEWWSVAPERAPQEAPDLPLPEPEAHVPTTRGNWESRNDRSEAEPEPAPVRIRTRGIPEIGSELEAGNTAANTPEWEIPTPDCEPTDFECWSALEEAIAIPVDGG